MDILSNINVHGDISFSGNIIGNIPGASISTEAYNSIKNINGLYSSFGYEDIPADKINDHGTLSISASQAMLGTIMGRTKPSTVVCDKWMTSLLDGSSVSSSFYTIPTHEGKYMIMSAVPFDQNGSVGCQTFYMKDDASVVFPYSFTLSPNDQINNWLTENGTKTNYNSLLSTGRHKVQGVLQSELSTYNAPFASTDPVVVYVQSDLAQPQESRPISQFVISPQGIYYRSGLFQSMPTTWTNLVSTGISISTLTDNIAQSKSDGLYVSGKSAIIPKFSNTGFTLLLSTPDKTFNNAVRYSDTFSITNPVGANSFGGISLYNIAEMKLNHYFVDAANNILDAKVDYLITSTTSSVLNFKVFVTIYGTPASLYSLSDDSTWPPEGGIVNIPISCKILLGTTPSALGY